MKHKTISETPLDAPQCDSGGIERESDSLHRVKKKQPTMRYLKGKAWQTFSRFIRLRDCLFTTGTKEYGKCITCGVTLQFNKLQAGHFIAGRHNANLFSEEGTHAQCRTCNILKSGAVLQYRRAIIDLYGDGYDEVLEREARVIKKFTPQDLIDLTEYYKKEITKLEEGTDRLMEVNRRVSAKVENQGEKTPKKKE